MIIHGTKYINGTIPHLLVELEKLLEAWWKRQGTWQRLGVPLSLSPGHLLTGMARVILGDTEPTQDLATLTSLQQTTAHSDTLAALAILKFRPEELSLPLCQAMMCMLVDGVLNVTEVGTIEACYQAVAQRIRTALNTTYYRIARELIVPAGGHELMFEVVHSATEVELANLESRGMNASVSTFSLEGNEVRMLSHPSWMIILPTAPQMKTDDGSMVVRYRYAAPVAFAVTVARWSIVNQGLSECISSRRLESVQILPS